MAESSKWPSWGKRSTSKMDRIPIGRGTMDPPEELYGSKRFSNANEARLAVVPPPNGATQPRMGKETTVPK